MNKNATMAVTEAIKKALASDVPEGVYLADFLAGVAIAACESEAWRPIHEHDGSEGPYDLWVTDTLYQGFRWRGDRWEKPRGYPAVYQVLLESPSHFRDVPQGPTT